MEIENFLHGKKKIQQLVKTENYQKTTFTLYDDGSLLAESVPDEPFKTYYRLSDEIKFSKDVQAKLAACEASYDILGDFVRAWLKDTAKLPDTILCRDVGVELYLRLGQWDKARVAINKIATAGAYSDGGQDALNHLERYRQAADSAIKFLRANPGFQQNKIYDALPEVDHDCLKNFIRSSYLIRKEKSGNTNRLYAK